jgi:hypothetical protein
VLNVGSNETLREIGLKDGDEITVETEIPFPWAHFPMAAQIELSAYHSLWYRSTSFRLSQYAGSLMNMRLRKQTGLSLYGPMYSDHSNTVKPWVRVDPMHHGIWWWPEELPQLLIEDLIYSIQKGTSWQRREAIQAISYLSNVPESVLSAIKLALTDEDEIICETAKKTLKDLAKE